VSGVATVEQVRARFPSLARIHNGHPVAYFDGPGGTQVPTDVVDAMREYLLHHNANTGWVYPSSEETDAMIAAARETTAAFLNAKPSEIAFGNNMTTLTFHLSRALGVTWTAGDEIVITDLDHHANIAPWRRLERERGVTVRRVRVNLDTGEIDWTALQGVVGSRTKIVAIGAGSNALGTITDVARAATIAHAAGALIFVDAVHYAPHELVDVRAMDCDFLACSPYKFYGPHAGVLYGREHLVAALDVPKVDPAPDWPSERLELGTQNHEGIIGTAAAITFLSSLSPSPSPLSPPSPVAPRRQLEATFRAVHSRSQSLFSHLWSGLQAIKGVTLYGPPPDRPRTPTVAFTLKGKPSKDVAKHLAGRAVFVSHGDFYASTIVKLLGHAEDGVVRAGCACYTTESEVDRLIEGVAEFV